MIAVIILAVVHAALSAYVFANHSTLPEQHLKAFLIVSIIVCLIIAVLSYYCMNLKM
jgi:uncharacterized membrane protein